MVSNWKIGLTPALAPPQVVPPAPEAPHRSTTQSLPSGAVVMLAVDPHFLPSGNCPQLTPGRYGSGRSLRAPSNDTGGNLTGYCTERKLRKLACAAGFATGRTGCGRHTASLGERPRGSAIGAEPNRRQGQHADCNASECTGHRNLLHAEAPPSIVRPTAMGARPPIMV